MLCLGHDALLRVHRANVCARVVVALQAYDACAMTRVTMASYPSACIDTYSHTSWAVPIHDNACATHACGHGAFTTACTNSSFLCLGMCTCSLGILCPCSCMVLNLLRLCLFSFSLCALLPCSCNKACRMGSYMYAQLCQMPRHMVLHLQPSCPHLVGCKRVVPEPWYPHHLVHQPYMLSPGRTCWMMPPTRTASWGRHTCWMHDAKHCWVRSRQLPNVTAPDVPGMHHALITILPVCGQQPNCNYVVNLDDAHLRVHAVILGEVCVHVCNKRCDSRT